VSLVHLAWFVLRPSRCFFYCHVLFVPSLLAQHLPDDRLTVDSSHVV
jgi:hypothetical protein